MTRPATLAAGLIAGFGRQLLTTLHQRRLRRRTDVVLSSLDDRILKDIGLHRDQNGRVLRPPKTRTDWQGRAL
jgi:uncharacterized protein YjiS (DUF1127 family)